MNERHGAPEENEQQLRVRDKRRFRPDDSTPSASPDAVDSADEKLEGSSDESDELAIARLEAASHLEDLQRLKAEFENYRKRVLREQTEIIERATVGLVSRLLVVLDNFELAVSSAEDTRDLERLLKGVEMVFGELKEVLRSEGLELIDAKGKVFDPNLHEAALEVPGDGDEPRVAEVLRSGYLYKGKVLRPAMVKVSRGSSESGGSEGA